MRLSIKPHNSCGVQQNLSGFFTLYPSHPSLASSGYKVKDTGADTKGFAYTRSKEHQCLPEAKKGV